MKKIKRSPFTSYENYMICNLVKTNGHNWKEISKYLPGRTPKQIRDRYMNYLRDGLNKSQWTPQEDELLIRMHDSVGTKWSLMSNKLPGRSPNDIKNRWNKHLSKTQYSKTELIENQTKDILIVNQEKELLIDVPHKFQNDANVEISRHDKLKEIFPNFYGLIGTDYSKKDTNGILLQNNSIDFFGIEFV